MIQTEVFSQRIQEHYAPPNLEKAILAAFASAGIDPDRLTLEALAPLDEFHIRGRAATIEHAQKLGLHAELQVLDVGSGLGGASRYLASTFGCQVTGLDLTEAYCRAAEMLAGRLGLSQQVRYQQGSALEMPFQDGEFDLVWTQHASMNIGDKRQLYREIFRVLKPGGRLALYDILKGPGGPVHLPVPWARIPEHSFLITPDDLRNLLQEIGFEVRGWRDVTEISRVEFNIVAAKVRQNGAPPLSYAVFLGSDFGAMVANVARNLNENRIVVREAILQKG